MKCGCAGVVWQARRRWPTRLARPPDQHTGHICFLGMFHNILLESVSLFLGCGFLGAPSASWAGSSLAPSLVSLATNVKPLS